MRAERSNLTPKKAHRFTVTVADFRDGDKPSMEEMHPKAVPQYLALMGRVMNEGDGLNVEVTKTQVYRFKDEEHCRKTFLQMEERGRRKMIFDAVESLKRATKGRTGQIVLYLEGLLGKELGEE